MEGTERPGFAGIRKLSYYLPLGRLDVNTPEEEAAIAAGEAKAAAEDRANRDRHAWLLANAPHPILRALIEAHHPDGDDRWPDCAECPRPPSEIDGDPEPEAWPCPVWMFISDRMDDESDDPGGPQRDCPVHGEAPS